MDPIVSLQPAAEKHWDETDPPMATLSRKHPLEASGYRSADPFRALCVSIANQQVSVQSGAAVVRRMEEAGAMDASAALALGGAGLRPCGLSRAKAGYVLDLATKFTDGSLRPNDWSAASDAAVMAELIAVKGIGPWTAKMYLMFHLDRPDVLAPEDLGLRAEFARHFGGTAEDAWRAMEKRGATWSPYNTVAARVLWKSRGED